MIAATAILALALAMGTPTLAERATAARAANRLDEAVALYRQAL